MPGCSVAREVVGTTARYVVRGKFEGACAWDLSSRLETEGLAEIVVDFSQVSDFVDYGVAVVANALLSLPQKRLHLLGLRQHQERLFRYFGVNPEELAHRVYAATPAPPAAIAAAELASKVA